MRQGTINDPLTMAEAQDSLPVARGPLAALLACIFFVSPLVFFTDLTNRKRGCSRRLASICIAVVALQSFSILQ